MDSSVIQVMTGEKKTELVDFMMLCFPIDFWKEKDWDDLLNDPRAVYFALLDGGQIIGNVFIYDWQGEDDYVKIMNLAVHPAYRGKGLAHLLLNHVTDVYARRGMKRFCAETRATNFAMQKVFDDCGYKFRTEEKNGFENPPGSSYKYELRI